MRRNFDCALRSTITHFSLAAKSLLRVNVLLTVSAASSDPNGIRREHIATTGLARLVRAPVSLDVIPVPFYIALHSENKSQ
jgi:hypothetical protein